jgi:hypothetical protein
MSYVNEYEFTLFCLNTTLQFYIVERNEKIRVVDHTLSEEELLHCLIKTIQDIREKAVNAEVSESFDLDDYMKPILDAQSIIQSKILMMTSNSGHVTYETFKREIFKGV